MTNLRRFVFTNLLLALFVFSAALSVFADPPSRAVRLKYISGAVSIQPGGVDDWVAGIVNRPLTNSDRVWTDKDARAELHLGSAALRMSAETSLTLTNVSDDIVQVELDQGTLNLHIRHLFGGETYEIDTPNQAFTILKAGDYRFDVDPSADTTSVTVWHGEGEANGQGPGVRLRSGHQASFTGGTSLEHQVASAPDLDGFDDWCRVRDNREDHARSYQYVSADVVGADDLDDYGNWRVSGNYGAVWFPSVGPGWAPYHNGHWVWVEPWGWTWVDEAPWGFAPSHYGRWVHVGGYWGWAPGPVMVARPVYAPALVAWVGGPHLSVNVSFGGGGGVAWFPLGWGEPYVPSYHVSRNYFQQVNVTNTHITNITKVTNNYYVTNNNTTVINNNIRSIHYSNQNINGAVTAVPTRAMTNSESVSRVAVVVPAHELRSASVMTAASVAPDRNSVLGARREASMHAPPARVVSARPVVSRVAPPERPVPFEAKREALARTPGRPLDSQTETQLRTNMSRHAPPASAQRMSEPAQAGTTTPATAAPRSPAFGTEGSRPATQPVAGTPQPQPTAPGRAIPRPPQRGEGRGEGMGRHAAEGPNAPSAGREDSRPGMRPAVNTPQSQPTAPGTSTARPSQPGTTAPVANTPAPATTVRPTSTPMPANVGRPVPRPPQIERTSNPRSMGAGPSSPQPAEIRRSERPSNPGQPSRAPQPAVESTRPATSRPMPIERPATVQPSRQVAAPQRTESRPQAESTARAPRPQAESRPQRQEQHSQKSQQSKREEKPERNNPR
jgi:hypothetical protein